MWLNRLMKIGVDEFEIKILGKSCFQILTRKDVLARMSV